MTPAPEPETAVLRLLDLAAVPGAMEKVTWLNLGGNNRTYLVETSERKFVAKRYFKAECDVRDRLGAEFDFLRFATAAAPGWTPAALAADPSHGWALYEHITGTPFSPGAVALADVEQAAAFFRALNQPDALPLARQLPNASDSGFSVGEHIARTDARVSQLRDATADDTLLRRYSKVTADLQRAWLGAREHACATASRIGIDLGTELPPADRCVSPSDFGFHNALRRPDGRVAFIDFEYAGWDDPAKMAGDMFCQVAVPLPGELFEGFVAAAFRDLPARELASERAWLLRPVLLIRWVCIVLNVFLPTDLARRRFANPNVEIAELQRSRLENAERLLMQLEDGRYGVR